MATSQSLFCLSTPANFVRSCLADALRSELLVANKIPESKVTFTQLKPLASFTVSTLALST